MFPRTTLYSSVCSGVISVAGCPSFIMIALQHVPNVLFMPFAIEVIHKITNPREGFSFTLGSKGINYERREGAKQVLIEELYGYSYLLLRIHMKHDCSRVRELTLENPVQYGKCVHKEKQECAPFLKVLFKI